jgi:LmbE family N-acetylglucosaminyl deacetylase
MAEKYYAMVITPHADDAEFGVAGTVSKWVRDGKKVVYVVCTNGNKGTDDPKIKPDKLAEIREKEQLAAAKVLGVDEVVFLKHDDQSLEETPEFRKELVRQIRIYRPDVVVTTDPYHRYIWHHDHRITGQVVLDAVFPYARDLLSYPDLIKEGLQPHKVKEVMFWGAEQPNYFSDITDTYDTKIAALRCHHSQVGNFSKEWTDFLRKRYEGFAQGKGFKLAEAFYRAEIWW